MSCLDFNFWTSCSTFSKGQLSCAWCLCEGFLIEAEVKPPCFFCYSSPRRHLKSEKSPKPVFQQLQGMHHFHHGYTTCTKQKCRQLMYDCKTNIKQVLWYCMETTSVCLIPFQRERREDLQSGLSHVWLWATRNSESSDSYTLLWWLINFSGDSKNTQTAVSRISPQMAEQRQTRTQTNTLKLAKSRLSNNCNKTNHCLLPWTLICLSHITASIQEDSTLQSKQLLLEKTGQKMCLITTIMKFDSCLPYIEPL